MDERLMRMSELHEVFPYDIEGSADARLRKKPVLETRLLSDCETLDGWETLTEYARISSSAEQALSGARSVKLTAPTNLPDWLPGRGRGRIYSEPGAICRVAHENWEAWNRLSVWVYPHVPGMKSLCLRLQLYNEGAHPVPDKYMREAAHNVNLLPDQWNHITCEIPHVHRDNVVGVALEYDMCGHEPDAADTCVWYIDKLELQKVVPDVCEGWRLGEGRIAFSGSGYLARDEKRAFACGLSANTFQLLDTATMAVALEKAIAEQDGFQILDFSEITKPGRYQIVAGNAVTGAFDIDENVWESSVWKVLNFYLSQRCGFEVAGKHRACHADLLLKHGDKAIVANGGWHDAADLAQGMNNTADGTTALLSLGETLREKHPRLARRVLEEGRWGLAYVLKTRFGDGFRSSYSSTSIWTDGVIGTEDDIVSLPTTNPFTNFASACAEATGARVLREEDPALSAYALNIAKEDFGFAREAWKTGDAEISFNDAGMQEVKLYAAATSAAAALVQAGAAEYIDIAAEMARGLMACQQTELPDWDVPLRGFFWRDRAHTTPWHHAHHSFEQYTAVGLAALLSALPNHPDAPLWKRSLSLICEFAKKTAPYTAPYSMLPEGVYHENEAEDYPAQTLSDIIWGTESELAEFKGQVQKGVPLGKGFYLRRMPVWFSFRGNLNVQLSQATALACAARACGDDEALALVRRQFEWVVGKNPFAQSLIFGEGYDWTDEYAVQPGQTVGQMPVGIQSLSDHDAPYWPQVCTATYKEVWICPANKWMWAMAYANAL